MGNTNSNDRGGNGNSSSGGSGSGGGKRSKLSFSGSTGNLAPSKANHRHSIHTSVQSVPNQTQDQSHRAQLPHSYTPVHSFQFSQSHQQSVSPGPTERVDVVSGPTSIPSRTSVAPLVHESPFVGSPLMVSDNFGQSLAHIPAPSLLRRAPGDRSVGGGAAGSLSSGNSGDQHRRMASRTSSMGDDDWTSGASSSQQAPKSGITAGLNGLRAQSEDDVVAGLGGMDIDAVEIVPNPTTSNAAVAPPGENLPAAAPSGSQQSPLGPKRASSAAMAIPQQQSKLYIQPSDEKSYKNTSRISRSYAGASRKPVALPEGEKEGSIPIMINWAQGGGNVYVTGTFNNWKQKIRMVRSNADFTTVIDMPPGTHRFKFIVDDEWKCSEDLPIASDADGNLVNYLEITDEAGEGQGDGLDGLSRFSDVKDEDAKRGVVDVDILASTPPEAYGMEIPSYLTSQHPNNTRHNPLKAASSSTSSLPSQQTSLPSFMSKPPTDPPPTLPPHLEKVLLNSHAIARDDRSTLPVPNHVTLNHMYACSIRDGVMAVGCTTRYRQKYITTVLYKPVFQ